MRELVGVLSSDSITRNMTRFEPGSLYLALADLVATGIPTLVSHDSHRLIGWTVPTAVSFQPGLTRLHGTGLLPENDDELDRLDRAYQRHVKRRTDEATGPFIDALRAAVAPHLDGSEKPHECAATALLGSNLARRVASAIFAQEDEDGLVPITNLRAVQPGVFALGDIVLFAHPFFRRSLSRWNNLNAPLLQELVDPGTEKGVAVRIRLDPDMVGLAASVRTPLELEYWYGPRFSNDLAAIPPGVTHHEATDRERTFHGISRTEFWWQSRDGEHILEAEELRDIPTLGIGPGHFGCRYVHSMVGEGAGAIHHLDGAIRGYAEEQLLERLGKTIATSGRHTEYTKLWRVDGSVSLPRWKTLIHHFFRDNTLVSEYLGHEDRIPNAAAPAVEDLTARLSQAGTQPTDLVRELLPPQMDPGHGVWLLLSLHELSKSISASTRRVHPLEDLVGGDKRVTVIDADTAEIEKLLRRKGESLSIPRDVARLAYEDRYHTFPLIRHDSAADVPATVAALSTLMSAWQRRGDDRVVALSLAGPLLGREIRLSIAGHIEDVSQYIEHVGALFRCATDDEVAMWTNATAERLERGVQDAGMVASDGVVERLMTPNATFWIARTMISSEEGEIAATGKGPLFRLRIPRGCKDLVDALNAGRLSPALALVVKSATCTKCGGEYVACPCSKYVDDNAGQRATDFEIAYPFWTDRPAVRFSIVAEQD